VRYGQPRKLKTRRGQQKAEQNAWCFTCQQPMARHGKNFACPRCRIATRIELTLVRGQGSRVDVTLADAKLQHPFCLDCRVRMHRFSRNSAGRPHSYRCRKCKAMTASHRDVSGVYQREREILELIEAGYLDKQIVKSLRCHHRTVARLRVQVSEPRRCDCGQLFYHTKKCPKRPGWQTLVRERRTAFDDLLVRINRRVPSSLPEEMRADICQEMLLQMMTSIDNVLTKVPDFIREYKKHYRFRWCRRSDSNRHEFDLARF
jgi:Zn finger protein HypA/HybF involved in hydrogenase expression